MSMKKYIDDFIETMFGGMILMSMISIGFIWRFFNDD